MDAMRFDGMTRSLVVEPTTRRHGLHLLTGAALGLLGRPTPAADAANGCLKEGKTCKRDNQCCSGLCKGTRDNQKCRRAPNQSVCTIRNDGCKSGPPKACGRQAGACTCFVDNAGRAVCIESPPLGGFFCESDAECVEQFGPGAKCLGRRDQCKASFCARNCPDPLPA